MTTGPGFVQRLSCCAYLLCALATVAVGQVTEDWVARWDGKDGALDVGRALTVDAEGNVYFTGSSLSNTTGHDYATIKCDASGNQLWAIRYNGPGNGNDSGRRVAVNSTGDVYVTGSSDGADGNNDFATVKYDSNGNQLWVARYDGQGDDSSAVWVALDAAGNVYVTGVSDSPITNWDYATIKYDPEGKQLWVARYNGPTSGNDSVRKLMLDEDGNVYITGSSPGVAASFDYATVKYDTNGNQLWVARYNGPGSAADNAYSLTVDQQGNVYVTGESRDAGNVFDYATIKYDSNGNQQWVSRYNGPLNGTDYGDDVAVDGVGNVFVTGSSAGGTTEFDYATVKYDSNGNEIWVARYSGPGADDDWANSIGVDATGCIYVTGASWGRGTEWDYATVKYNQDGNQVWVARYNGPGNSDDRANALTLDALGNVYVTGLSWGSGSHHDYATVKYSQGTTLAPSSFSLYRGTVFSGNLLSLLTSDDDRLILRPHVVFSSQESPIQLILNATAPNATPSRLEFTVEALGSSTSISQGIALYNFDTQNYEALNTSMATISDSTIVVVVTSNPGRFIGPNLELRSRVSYKANGPIFAYPWNAQVDQVKWKVVD